MARQESVLTVFIASPSDLADERVVLEEVVGALNTAWSKELGVRLELVKWETHAYPAIGSDPQELINRQIGSEYDIFVGLMWCRFGTATGRAGSGTVEEFDIAKRRFEANPNAVQVMFYFKDAPVSPSKLDLEQLARVQSFRYSLGSEGVLYWTFTDADQFKALATLHLTRQLQKWSHTNREDQVSRTERAPVAAGEYSYVADEELGILDYADIISDQTRSFVEVMDRLSSAQVELAAQLAQRTSEVGAAQQQGPVSAAEIRRNLAAAARDLTHFADRVDAEIPLLKGTTEPLYRAFAKLAILTATANLNEKSQALAHVGSLKSAVDSARGRTAEFEQLVASFPPLTGAIMKANSRVRRSLSALADQFSYADKLLTETILLGESA